MDALTPADRRALGRQRAFGRATAVLWIPLCVALMRFGFGWRLSGEAEVRGLYRQLRREARRAGVPMMVCANHLTMLDSFLVAWALGGVGFYLRDHGGLPWNTPERANFAASVWQRALVWIARCIPLTRGGSRAEIARALARVQYVLGLGDAVLMFPEGGRSRSGRVDRDSAAWGVGRVVGAAPGCRVLCVYLRGEGQGTWSDRPRRRERFRVSAALLEPKSDQRGLRASRDLSRQIAARLADLEERHFRVG